MRKFLEVSLLERPLTSEEKHALQALLRHKSCADSKPLELNFIFVGHGRERLNALQGRFYSKEYAMMDHEECKITMPAFEKHIIGPAMGTLSRKLFLTGAISYRRADAPVSLLGGSGSSTTVGAMRALPFIPKDYFHPWSKKLLFNLLKRMAMEEVHRVESDSGGSSADCRSLTLGLGALNKFVQFTNNGKYLADIVDSEIWRLKQAGKPYKQVFVVTGNTMTAACVFANIERLITDKTSPIFFNGATSNIGKAVITKMVSVGYSNITFHTGSEVRAKQLIAAIKEYCGGGVGVKVRFTTDAAGMWKFRHCVLGSSADLPPCPAEAAADRPPRFIGFAYPLPKNTHQQASFEDIGNLQMPKSMTVGHQLLLPRGQMFSCMSGTAVHSAMGWTHHEVGDIDVDRMKTCWDAAMALGFELPALRQQQQ
jgi:hypothetical protein